jgi:phosphate transport system ATP-binding protein
MTILPPHRNGHGAEERPESVFGEEDGSPEASWRPWAPPNERLAKYRDSPPPPVEPIDLRRPVEDTTVARRAVPPPPSPQSAPASPTRGAVAPPPPTAPATVAQPIAPQPIGAPMIAVQPAPPAPPRSPYEAIGPRQRDLSPSPGITWTTTPPPPGDATSGAPASAAASNPTTPVLTAGTLTAQDLSAWFGTKKVLERCSLQMPAGRVTAIIGPSGCGKSVFLRNLNRMHEVIPTAKTGGLITLDGVDIHGAQMSPTEVRLRIGMVFQRPNPFPSMSIRENVLAGLKLSGTKIRDADELVEWALTRAGLWREVKDRLNTSGAALSGGQQQRLCIARSLAVRPRVLLMDEPCSALDPISTNVIEETILEIADEITVVIVTHNMQQAQRIADLCAFFMIEAMGTPGKIVEAGSTDQIFNNPRDRRTADYVSGRFG